jgi:hypothetical protein
MKRLVLAFDIERSGASSEYDTIALGASVVDSDMKQLDRYYANCFFPTETKFEPRCYYEFWSKNDELLNSLIYDGALNKNDREKEMIVGFQQFRRKWETYARDNNLKLFLSSDNNVYDGGFVNILITKYTCDLPIPYSASTREYDVFFETHSMQRGILMASGIDKEWGLTEAIASIYEVPTCDVKHDHNPANDAYTIAFDTQVLFGILDKKIKKKSPVYKSETPEWNGVNYII